MRPNASASPELASDAARVKDALTYANVPTLALLVVQLTGELRWLEAPYLPTPIGGDDGLTDHDTGDLPAELQDEIRAAALDAILAWKAGKPIAIPHPSDTLLDRMMCVSVGERVPEGYRHMVAYMLKRAPELGAAKHPHVTVDDFTVLIIGAGVSGLCAAVKLQERGISYRIIERNANVGGCWVDNRYPGCGVDTPNHLYSFSWTEPYPWTRYFCSGEDLHRYLEQVTDDYNIRSRILFGTEATRLEYDKAAQGWSVDVRNSDGVVQQLRANVVISAIGLFNPPKLPDIKGLDAFEGRLLHTASWPDGVDLTNKRIAVVGSGASAMQLVPAIVDKAKSVTVFQRSPAWSVPVSAKWRGSIAEPLRQLMLEVPLYSTWYRIRLGWIFNDRNYDQLQKDPSWAYPDRSLNAVNDATREYLTNYIRSELAGRPDLIKKSVPDYPPFGKRMLLDHGWYKSLVKANVELVTENITEIRKNRVVTAAGEYPVDMLALATGYDVQRFLSLFETRGRSGRFLREIWGDDDGRAYFGCAIPDFPNFFCLYGPNTQPAHGGTYITVAEHQTEFVISAIAQMAERKIGSIEIKPEVLDNYIATIDAAHEKMVWTHPGMTTYYRNSKGRVVINSPFRNYDFWRSTQAADLDLFFCEPKHKVPQQKPEQDALVS